MKAAKAVFGILFLVAGRLWRYAGHMNMMLSSEENRRAFPGLSLSLPGWLRAALTGAALDALKIIAALLMVVDHANHIFFVGKYFDAYLLGRAAFPLFCFAAAAAIIKGSAASCYRQALLLLALAVVTEPVSLLTRDYPVINVLFTLAAAMAVAPWMLALSAPGRVVVYTAVIVATAWPGVWEFGLPGVFLPSALALFLAGRRLDGAFALVLAALMNFSGYADIDWSGVRVGMAAAIVFCTVIAPVLLAMACGRLAANRPWAGRRLLPRYTLHVFYPLHLLILWGLFRLAGQG